MVLFHVVLPWLIIYELRIMFRFLVPSYIPDTCIKLHGVTSQQGKHHCSEKLRSQPQADSDTFWLVHRHTDKLITHTKIRYLNLQSHINQILVKTARTCWVSHKMRSEVLKVVIMMLLVTLVQPLYASRYVTSSDRNLPPPSPLMMEAAGTLKCWWVSARLHSATTGNIFDVRSVWGAKDKQQQLSYLYPQQIVIHSNY